MCAAASSSPVVSDDNDDDMKDEEYQKLIDEFVGITNTNDALAQMFLQQRKWKLLPAVNDYFEQVAGDSGPRPAAAKQAFATVVTLSSDSDADDESSSPAAPVKKKKRLSKSMTSGSDASAAVVPTPSSRSELIFVTWNIDGISNKNLNVRTEAVVTIVLQIKPDVLFLQEVVPESESILRAQLAEQYSILSGRMWQGFEAQYYTLTLVRKETASVLSHKVLDYDCSVMTRNVTLVQVDCSGIIVNVLNTHLESTKEYAAQRMKQMVQLGRIVKNLPATEPVIVAGDLNMRDKELEEAGGLPDDWIDVWEACGKKPEQRYTWDTLRNDNLDTNFGRFKPRCRFDRVLVKDTKPSSLAPHTFSLIGIERLKPHVCFPSDHWGLLTVFNTTPPVTRTDA